MAAPACSSSEEPTWFSWGANSYGQLGQGHQSDVFLPKAINGIPANVTNVCGGGGHTLFLKANGECYACGWNQKGQLGLGSGVRDKEITVAKQIDKQQLSDDIWKIAAGWDHSMVITKNGLLYSFGSNAFGQLGSDKDIAFSSTPVLVPNPTESKIDVSCGMRHSIILAGTAVYTCGSGKKGQLGLNSPDGTQITKTIRFEKVTLPAGQEKVIQVIAGSNHSAALTDTGQIIVWGDNKHGQLAIDPDTVSIQPTPMVLPEHLFDNHKVTRIYSGWTHMLALTDAGLLYSWGRCQYGQLGVRKTSQDSGFCQWKPHLLSVTNPKQIVCGAEHNLLISDKNQLYAWGWNEHGMCGSGGDKEVSEPEVVKALEEQKVLAIGSGSGHSFALVVS